MKYANFKQNLRTLTALFLIVVSCGLVSAQQITVKGVVKDASSGEPILGANILEKGTTNGTITNLDGEFSLNVSSNSTLLIKYVGYETKEVAVAGQKNLVIQIKEDAIALGEVVAIGYATVKKNDATGSITAIKPDALNKGLTTNAQDMLTGKIAGVNVTSGGGTPGGGATIRIRGGSSLNASNDPLIVIDGLPIDNKGIQGVANPLSTINPNDIESFTVLKDASATAIYGSRASNGVIIITTKKGAKGSKPTFTYNGNFSVGTIRKYIEVMDGDEFREYATKLYEGNTDILSHLGTANTDWQSKIYQTAIGHDHNVNVTGGLKNMPYRASIGYTNLDGILKTSNFERYTGNIGLSPSFFDNYLKVNVNFKAMLTNQKFANTDAISAAVRMDPTQTVYSADEPFASSLGGYWQWYNASTSAVNSNAPGNPLSLLMLRDDKANAYDLMGNIEVDYKFHFFPDMHLHANAATDIAHGKQDTWNSEKSFTNMLHGGSSKYEIKDKWNRLFNTYLQYNKEFKNQKVDAIGGYEWQRFHSEGNYFEEPLIGDYVYQADPIYWATHNQLVSFFGRVNYTLSDKYLFTATIRADGSSRFSPENRWGYFPSFAFAWKMKDDFMKDIDVVSDFKLRLGYGKTGQQDGIGDYTYLPVYSKSKDGAYYQFGDTYYSTARPDAYNKDLKWETTTTYNAGVDISLFNNRLTAALDVYYRNTDDLLNTTSIPAGTNFRNKVLQNIGSLNNRGVEVMLNWKAIAKRDLTLDLSYNVTYNRNKITKLTAVASEGYYVATGGIFQGQIQAHMVGYPAFSYYVYEQVYDNQGKPIEGLYVDRNGDNIINEKDRYLFHNSNPDVTMGFAAKLIYKSFDLGMTLRSNIGNYMYNAMAAERLNVGSSGIWSSLGYFENKPKISFDTNFTGGATTYLSDYFVQNASFVRVDNITFGYSFKKMFGVFSGGRVSATVQNPFVFTKYKGLDPEVFGGIDGTIYPKPVTSIIGLTLNF